MSNLISVYDNEWTTTVTNSNASLDEIQNTKGCFLGNGKIGMISALDRIGVQKSIITTSFDFNESGLYNNNVIDAFNHSTIKVFDNKQGPETASTMILNSQSLNMFNGIASTNMTFTNMTTSDMTNVSYDIYPIRHLPYCSMQTITITPAFNSSSNNPTINLFHEISTENNITSIDYNNNVIYNELVSPLAGMYMLNGKGIFSDTQKTIAVACCYLFEQNNFKLVGFNRYRKENNRCFQKLVLQNFTSGQSYKFHIFTTQMSEYDFKSPNEEVKRISVNILNKLQTTEQIAQLRQNHVSSWFNMWKSNISIEPKAGITQQEANEFNSVKRTLRYSMYNIWSSVREGIRTEVNPLSLSVIDNQGTIYWDGDLWFLPVLIMMRPDIAKTVLEARYKVIDQAIQLAAGYGYQGSKFPYVNDVTGYSQGPYWDLNGPLHIFNTALISISVWNYYRITQDKDWMMNKGYTILKNNANFFVSKLSIDENGLYHIEDVYSFHDKVSTDNALTNYLIKVALKYCLEASYEFNIVAKEEWGRAYYNIDLTSFTVPNFGIVKNDSTTTPTDTFKFLEMLIPLLAYYNDTFFKTTSYRDLSTIQDNFNFFKTKVQTAYQNNPMNNMILSWISAQLLNYDSIYPDIVNTYILKTINENVKGVWGNFNMNNNNTEYNDVSLSSLFVLMMMTTVGTLKITGSVSETRFYNESMGIKGENTTNMPRTWKNVKVTGVGVNNCTIAVLNNVYYT